MPFEKNVRKFGSNSDIFRPFGSEYFAFSNRNLDRLTAGIFTADKWRTKKKKINLCVWHVQTNTGNGHFWQDCPEVSASCSSGKEEKGNLSSWWKSWNCTAVHSYVNLGGCRAVFANPSKIHRQLQVAGNSQPHITGSNFFFGALFWRGRPAFWHAFCIALQKRKLPQRNQKGNLKILFYFTH